MIVCCDSHIRAVPVPCFSRTHTLGNSCNRFQAKRGMLLDLPDCAFAACSVDDGMAECARQHVHVTRDKISMLHDMSARLYNSLHGTYYKSSQFTPNTHG